MIRKWFKEIIIEALHEWEQEVEYLGREGYKWENNQWVPTKTEPYRLDELQEREHRIKKTNTMSFGS